MKIKIFITLNLMFISLFANNLKIANVQLVNQNITDHTVYIQFDISWDNSWRGLNFDGTEGWDAAWIIVKFRYGCFWHTAYLEKTKHQTVSGATIAANDSIGVMIYRSSVGVGTFSKSGIKLCWNYGKNGLSDQLISYSLANTDSLEIAVLGTEMVYIPEGAFQVGGYNTGHHIYAMYKRGTSGEPYTITENVIIGTADSLLWADYHWETLSNPETLDVNFPTGYRSFYCMKYEVNQQQYVDFLNMLLYDFALKHAPDTTNSNGKTIYLPTTTDLKWKTNYPYLPVFSISPTSAMAYADWIGMRLMTELEFEKVCRGTKKAVYGEFVWGDNTIHNGLYTVINENTADEQVLDADTINGNVVAQENHPNGPLRCGIFAGSPNNVGFGGFSRSYTGATFYGVMEMGGNVWEPCVSLAYHEAHYYRRINGDGELDSQGYGNQYSWTNLTDTRGIGYKGGAFDNSITGEDVNGIQFVIGNRSHTDVRVYFGGIRCVRDMNNALIISK